jgi:hypothetical protein
VLVIASFHRSKQVRAVSLVATLLSLVVFFFPKRNNFVFGCIDRKEKFYIIASSGRANTVPYNSTQFGRIHAVDISEMVHKLFNFFDRSIQSTDKQIAYTFCITSLLEIGHIFSNLLKLSHLTTVL